jgi:hypothetical protein
MRVRGRHGTLHADGVQDDVVESWSAYRHDVNRGHPEICFWAKEDRHFRD